MLKLIEINELSGTELIDQINKSRKELVDLRMKFASRQLEDPSCIRKKRKEIARLLTIETQRLKNNGGVKPVVKEKKSIIKSIVGKKSKKEVK